MISLLEKFNKMSGQFHSNLDIGHHVLIVKKKDQKSGILTKGHID